MDTPKHLYRFFKKQKYRGEFLTGKIRFGKLELYQTIEDEKRRDDSEGEARGKYKTDKLTYLTIDKKTGKQVGKGITSGDMHISGTSLDHNFIVCFSGDDVDLKSQAKKMGKYVVKINNIDKLLDLLNQKCKLPWRVGRITLMQVKYDKDEYLEMDENSHLPFEYFVSQKPRSFASESEWRLVMVGSAVEEVSDDYVTVVIGSIQDIANSVNL